MNSHQRTKIVIQSSKDKTWDETFRMMSGWDSSTVANARVMVVGAGALGNEVLKNLALLNVGNILIVDFDNVEYANLCRSVLFRESDCHGDHRKCEVAAARVREINPNVRTMSIHGDIWLDVGLGVFRRMDVVIGCLDNRLARKFINRHCYSTGKTWIDGAIENFAGQLDVYKPWVSCYECQLTELEERMIQYRLGCPDIAIRNANNGKIPTTPISSSIIGAMQVLEALKVIYKNDAQSLAGKQFRYEGMNNVMLLFGSSGLKEHCESHFTIDKVIEAKELSANKTVGELLDWLKNYFSDDGVKVCLDYQVILEIYMIQSEISYPVVMAKPHFSDKVALQYQQEPGEEIAITQGVVDIDDSFPRKDIPLRQIGIPPLQILLVRAKDGYHYVELTGDEDFLDFKR
jgi:molybdopterin/thiamine biosynthesis adenylyltransferase